MKLILLVYCLFSLSAQALIFGDVSFKAPEDDPREFIKDYADSVGMIIENNKVQRVNKDTSIISGVPIRDTQFEHRNDYFNTTYNYCSDTPFIDENKFSTCSMFLIDKDIIATAGHCLTPYYGAGKIIEDESCYDLPLTFTFDVKNSFSKKQVVKTYSCNKIIKASLPNLRNVTGDYAFIKLDRKVEGIKPLPISKRHSFDNNSSFYTIGSPLGLTIKSSAPGRINSHRSGITNIPNLDSSRSVNQKHVPLIHAYTDGVGGISGAPIFDNDSHKAIAIYIESQDPFFKLNNEKGCYEFHKCRITKNGLSSCRASVFVKLSNFDFIKETNRNDLNDKIREWKNKKIKEKKLIQFNKHMVELDRIIIKNNVNNFKLLAKSKTYLISKPLRWIEGLFDSDKRSSKVHICLKPELRKAFSKYEHLVDLSSSHFLKDEFNFRLTHNKKLQKIHNLYNQCKILQDINVREEENSYKKGQSNSKDIKKFIKKLLEVNKNE